MVIGGRGGSTIRREERVEDSSSCRVYVYRERARACVVVVGESVGSISREREYVSSRE